MKSTKVVFMGTPDFSVPVLETLIEHCDVIGVVTQPDKEVGRKREIVFSPIKNCALEHGIKVLQPVSIRQEYEEVTDLNPDIIVTCAYGQIIPKVLLDFPKYGCINVHASLLPKLRGGAPIHKAIIEGYKETGVTIMYMDEGMDSGDIISQQSYLIKQTDNVGTLHDILSVMGARLLIETLPSIINGTNNRVKQDAKEVTFAYTVKREEEHLDFNDKVLNVYNKIRGLNPWPLANMNIDDVEYKVLEAEYELKDNLTSGEIVEVSKTSFKIACRDGIISIKKIKPFGKKAMDIKDFLNGIDKEKLLKARIS